ncbi:MAG: DUF262 domain-containing protein [Fibromonadaceae bacterium]|jgi:uncharacterized protein with ParB-like and HNH nuclease domain|nr:DUF262 domain-containing protein [Fibromonadaceae bacterium]
MSEIDASIKKIKDVLNQNLEIPNFQRPYCWDDRNVRQLLQDVYDSWKSGKQSYRIGSTILYTQDQSNKGKSMQIVDGQQRITTILLILRELKEKNIGEVLCSTLQYEHEESQQNILGNNDYIKKWISERISNEKSDFYEYLIEHCEFVEIKVTDLSEAFQMFDSQNGRGKALEAYNLLKAYHIRAMEVESQDIKIECDKRWESATRYKINPNNEKENTLDILKQVVNEQLYRTRKWSRKSDAYSFDNSHISEFKGVSISKQNPIYFPYQNTDLLNYIATKYFESIGLDIKGIKSRFYQSAPENINPFVLINQNIINGKHFFDYIETYIEIYKRLFLYRKNDSLKEFHDFFDKYCQYKGSNRLGDTYLREAYKSLIFIMFDKFGEEGLYQYYRTLYVLIYRLRLEYMQVKYDKVAQYPKDLFASIEKAKELNLNTLNKKALEEINCRKDISEIQQVFIDYGVTIKK